MISTHFQRYKPLIDDWQAFTAAVQRPLPKTLWANPQRISATALEHLLGERGIELQPLPWYPGGFTLPEDAAAGQRWEFLAGLYHLQEAVSMLPPLLLDVQPTDRVLDLCAAPGNKTVQFGVAMGHQGTLVAVDRSAGRMRASRQAFNRLGLVNVTAVTHDAANLPRSLGQFDKVLADVPCTCEGTCRKVPAVMERVSLTNNEKMARIQKAILRKAIQLCRPGGRIVYSTCTFAPEENELVIDAVLRQYEGLFRLLPVEIPHFKIAPGLTAWGKQRLDPSLANAARIWPHDNDSGGFFIALLEKMADPAGAGTPTPVAAEQFEDQLEPDPWRGLVTERFGFPAELFAGYEILRQGNRGVWLVNGDNQPPSQPSPDSVGMMFMRTQGRYPKITSGAALTFGASASRHVIDLEATQARAYYLREEFPVEQSQLDLCDKGSGYVLLRYQGYVIGVGVLRTQKQTVESQFPKGWVKKNILV